MLEWGAINRSSIKMQGQSDSVMPNVTGYFTAPTMKEKNVVLLSGLAPICHCGSDLQFTEKTLGIMMFLSYEF